MPLCAAGPGQWPHRYRVWKKGTEVGRTEPDRPRGSEHWMGFPGGRLQCWGSPESLFCDPQYPGKLSSDLCPPDGLAVLRGGESGLGHLENLRPAARPQPGAAVTQPQTQEVRHGKDREGAQLTGLRPALARGCIFPGSPMVAMSWQMKP